MLQKKGEKLNVPTNYFCNQNCVFCSEKDKKQFHFLKEEPKKHVLKLLKKGANKGTNKVVFTSGEPTLSPYIEEYIKKAKELGYSNIGLITNGSTLNKRETRKKLSLLNQIIVSVHGMGKIHNGLTQNPQVFNKVVKGLIKYKKENKGIEIHIGFVLNKKNLLNIYKTIVFFIDYVGADLFIVNTMRPDGYGRIKFADLSIKYSELIKFYNGLDLNKKEKIDDFIKQNKVKIMDVPVCVLLDFLNSNLAEQVYGKVEIRESLSEGKKDIVNNMQEDKKYIDECHKCKYINQCEGIYKEYIKFFGKSEFKAIK